MARFSDLLLLLKGATSGEQILKTAASTSGAITLPAGTTDFSATTGVVQQATTGAPFTVGPVTASQISGTNTNDSAPAGYVGEFISSVVPSASAIALTTNVPANVTSVSLTAGDWQVDGSLVFNGSTSTYSQGQVGTTSAGNESPTAAIAIVGMSHPVGFAAFPTGSARISIAVTTTVYLVGMRTFPSGTATAYGTLRARRMR